MAEGSPRYSCPFFNQHVRVPATVTARVDADHAREYEDVRHCIGLIIVNLLAMGEVAYSRNSNFYTEHGTRLFTLTSMRKAVDAAVRSGHAVRSREGYWDKYYVSGLSSTLAPGPRLAEFGPPPPLELDIESLPLLAVDKRQVFGESDLAAIMSGATAVSPGSLPLLPRLGEAYAEALRLNRGYWNRTEIGTGGLAQGSLCMGQAGLTRLFKAGGVGRWFQRGGLSYQELPKGERAKLRLNGEAVAELDYPAMHPHLMYAWEGKPCPDDFYERVMALCGCPRPVAKRMALMAVNAGSHRALSSAVNFSKREGEPNLYDELKASGLTPGAVVAALVEAHPTLERHVFSGQANRLMLAESDITTAVLLGLAGRGIPALPVHDSLVFPVRHREAVRGVMEREFLLQTGQPIAVE